MAFVRSTDPIPQNSLIPPPAWKGAAADRRRAEIFQESRTGRERVYANLPTVENLASVSFPLAVHAQGMIAASEVARQAILNGIGDQGGGGSLFDNLAVDINALIAGAPKVLSLNGSTAIAPALANTGKVSAGGGNTTVYPTMPARAPIPIPGMGGVYLNPRPAPGPVRSKPVNRQAAPPGCGLSGFSPVWGNAYAGASPAGCPGGGSSGLSWGWLAAAAGVGLLVFGKTRRGRY